MASIAARLTVIGENGYGEPEQDANSALTELDKGLRSGKIGEQCEAIVRFPRLFEKYPFPILINSAFLKLADVFRIDNNFLRLCILKVTQQSEKHLDKILNVDEFVRRIFAVIHSNDPIARSLTLRTLGSIATIIPEWKNVHHSIRISLDSHDSMELQAAIFAVEKFAAQSRTFASNICSKIGQMIEGLATPSNIKLELIAILQHMHHDAETAVVVHKLCVDLLPKYPTQEFVTVILNTLTQLSAASLLFIENQVLLLMSYMLSDVRNVVKMSALRNLKVLVKKCAQFWKQADIESLCTFASNTPYSELKYAALDVLANLAQSIAVANFNVSSSSIYLHLCDDACYDQNLQISSKAVELLTHLAIHIYQEDHEISGLDIYEEAVVAVESLLLAATLSQAPSRMKALKLGLVCAVQLCESKSDACQSFVNSIGSLIMTSTGPCAILMCEALAAIANRKVGVLSLLLPDLIQRLEEMPKVIKKDHAEAKTLVMMIVLLFQGLINHPSESHAERVVKKAILALDLWDCYKIARQAARYGHHHIAADIFVHLSNRVCSEHFHFWLVALSEFCYGESFLQSQVKKDVSQVEYVATASVYYMKGISALKAATTPTNLLQFQCEYVRLRADVLQAHAQLVRTCTSLKTSPPPAIAAAVATATRDELQRCGRITLQLRKCVREFRSLGDQYGRLYQSVFDADPITLLNLQVLQQNCFLIAHAVDTVALKVHNLGFLEEPMSEIGLGTLKKQEQHTIETFGILSAAQEAVTVVTNFNQQNDHHKLIGHQHIDELLRVSKIIVDVPLCFPRYFFQSLQATSIKLAISPQPRVPGEPVNIQNHCHLALKVEGVVQHGAKQGLFRKVQSIILNISSTLQNRTQTSNDLKMPGDLTNNMTQTVVPHNDYFNSQFLLAFPVPGLHIITVEVSVIDEMENVWKTGPRSSLTIKSFDDAASQKQPQSSSSTRIPFQQRF